MQMIIHCFTSKREKLTKEEEMNELLCSCSGGFNMSHRCFSVVFAREKEIDDRSINPV